MSDLDKQKALLDEAIFFMKEVAKVKWHNAPKGAAAAQAISAQEFLVRAEKLGFYDGTSDREKAFQEFMDEINEIQSTSKILARSFYG